jgi:sugar O-acyltransferase (sialic acid O-acetyltransferase NeuD family)
MSRRLVIWGAGGHGRVVADAAETNGLWSSIAFLDDGWPARNASGPWPVIGSIQEAAQLLGTDDDIVIAIGHASVRMNLLSEAGMAGGRLVSVVHDSAVISRHASIGIGTVVLAGAVINPGVMVGDGCIINTSASVDHDCRLGAGVHICPGARLAGEVVVGERTWIGIGSCVRQGIVIGADVTVGAGAVVVSNCSDGVTVMGVPARVVGQ